MCIMHNVQAVSPSKQWVTGSIPVRGTTRTKMGISEPSGRRTQGVAQLLIRRDDGLPLRSRSFIKTDPTLPKGLVRPVGPTTRGDPECVCVRRVRTPMGPLAAMMLPLPTGGMPCSASAWMCSPVMSNAPTQRFTTPTSPYSGCPGYFTVCR